MTKNIRYYSGNVIKTLTILMLGIAATMLVMGEIGAVKLPAYAKISPYDIYFWVTIMSLQAGILIALLFCDGIRCYKCNNVVLSTAGLSLMIIGGMFSFKYPPYSWQMTTFPFVGFLIIVAGRKLNKDL